MTDQSDNPLAPAEPTRPPEPGVMPAGELMERYVRQGERHNWIVRGPKGAVHIWAEDMTRHSPSRDPWYGLIGGIECHYAEPPDYMHEDAPSREDCWILNGRCWHDGSSLQFSENFGNQDGLDLIRHKDWEPFFAL
ncbi:MAG: hypothetical protein VXW22_16810, partial [Pseudomonadota bacterium]|nr:hypothetical protein [Pseudomonadota bacterium]